MVTDDSDAFAFGGRTVYKNIFNDRKYVEAYLLPDVEKVRVLSALVVSPGVGGFTASSEDSSSAEFVSGRTVPTCVIEMR